jgi:hypothetical protein
VFAPGRFEQSLKYAMSASPTAFVTPAATIDFAPHPKTGTKSRTEFATLLPISYCRVRRCEIFDRIYRFFDGDAPD